MSGDDDNWMAGYGDAPAPSRRAPSSWSPGQSRRLVPALCCTGCGALSTRCHGEVSAGQHLDYWSCTICGNRWKLPADLQRTKAWIDGGDLPA